MGLIDEGSSAVGNHTVAGRRTQSADDDFGGLLGSLFMISGLLRIACTNTMMTMTIQTRTVLAKDHSGMPESFLQCNHRPILGCKAWLPSLRFRPTKNGDPVLKGSNWSLSHWYRRAA